MAAVRKTHLEQLRPYLIGEHPRENGEWDMHCPLHEDVNRSASLNINIGEWYCNAGCGGGLVTQLIRQKEEWVDPPDAARNGSGTGGKATEQITEGKVQGWAAALMASDDVLDELMEKRGLTVQTLRTYEIGWDSDADGGRGAYTIPVRDDEGNIANVRRYTLNPEDNRRKIWSVKGMGSPPRLYPIQIFDTDPKSIIVCEGEWDALLSIQNGYPAVTRTAAAKVWQSDWGHYFRGMTVWLCHDRDETGEDANRVVARALQRVAKAVRIITLPYEFKRKHGADLSDFWKEHTKKDFIALLHEAKNEAKPDPEVISPDDVGVMDSFDAKRVGKPTKMTVTVKGRREPGYSVPSEARYECTRDAGSKCQHCPLNAAGGDAELAIEADDPVILELMDSTRPQLHEILRAHYGAIKCTRLNIEITKHQAVEILFARPSVDHVAGSTDAADFKNIKITSVGRHDTGTNNTVEITGALHPDPRKQTNEFQAWDVSRMETSLDHFELDESTLRLLRKFQPQAGQRPLKKARRIADEIAAHVTKIYGRPEMHALIDLVFHSVIAFNFADQRVERGWLDALIVGDTRTGKSESVKKMIRHYGAGELVSCESASFAGIIGGLQQYGSSKEWAINWGAIPINDRRLVALDEVSGLTPEEIGQMSDVRSSGVAKLTKIQSEMTMARTRLIWMGNPRNQRMSDFTYGVQAIAPLVGNNEDVARFDLAMSVKAGEVSLEEINAYHDPGKLRYTQEACHALVRWVWSRKPDQVKWGKGAEKEVFKAAGEMAARYTEDPPLVQGANIRIKIARVAVALAARLFSTDDTGEIIMVTKDHVVDAVKFLDHVYAMPGFGYGEQSKERIGDARDASKKQDEMKAYLVTRRGLSKFLRSNPSFRRQDLEEVLNVPREEANAIISNLYEARMVRKVKGDVKVEPTLHQILREVKI